MKAAAVGLLLILIAALIVRQIETTVPASGRHLVNIHRITHVQGTQNTGAYISPDGTRLIYQSARPPDKYYRFFTMDLDGSDVRPVSAGAGLKSGLFSLTGNHDIVYASTHEQASDWPQPPDLSRGYLWTVHKDYDVYIAKADGTGVHNLTHSPGYDGESTLSPDGKHIIFTSQRDGDLDVYTMDLDGSNIRRLTSEVGYDGGAYYSWDTKRIVYRAYHPVESQEVERFRSLLAQGLVEGKTLEIMVMNADGSGKRQLTQNGRVNFAPSFGAGNQQIIFSSNLNDSRGTSFQLYLMNVDGSGLEQVTFEGTFNSFPMFTKDGSKLVFASNGYGSMPGEINIFVANWKY